MEQLLSIILLYQTILFSFIGYQYYNHVTSIQNFKNFYLKLVTYSFRTGFGITILTHTLDYIKYHLPNDCRSYVQKIIVDLHNQNHNGITNVHDEIRALKREIETLKSRCG